MYSYKQLVIIVITSIAPWFEFSSCHSDRPSPIPAQNNQHKEVSAPSIDETRVMELCSMQVSFGPRVPNLTAHDQCRDFILKELKQYSDTVLQQSFSEVIYDKTWKLCNIIGQINAKASDRIMFCAHWDSRPRSDEDKNRENFEKGVPAANDGASGVALLLELARCFHTQRPDIGIDLVFFDGEDIGMRTDGDNFCIGSRYFSRNFPLASKPRYAVLFDMVGDKDARFLKEQGSSEHAGPLVDRIWQLGKIYAPDYFVDQIGSAVTDDHRQLINMGIPAVDIIDMELIGNSSADVRRRYWHTQDDVMSNISGRTLRSLGDVILQLVYSNPYVM